MVSVLHLLSYVGGLAGFLFITLSLASGLLWLAELIEEHSKYAKTIGMRAIYTIITLHIVLYFTDSLPILPTLFSIFCHLVYLQNFSKSWPYISLTSLKFLASCVLVVADHFTWFFHFAARAQEQKRLRGTKYRHPAGARVTGGEESFMDIAAFFGICVWFVPLFLFLSLSANDNALPSLNKTAPPTPSGQGQTVDLASPALEQSLKKVTYRSKSSLVKSVLMPVIDYLPRLGSNRKGRQDPEGIIAPRTPVRGSPLHTPVNMPSASTTYFPWNGSATGSDDTSSLSLSRSQSRASSPGPGLGLHMGIGKGRPGQKTPPPPRRVQSEMMTQGLNPRGIATRNGAPAVPDGAGSVGGYTEEPTTMRRSTPSRPSTPSMSLGPDRGEVLGRVEIVDTKGQAQPKRKDD